MPKLLAMTTVLTIAALLLIVGGRPSAWNGMRPATCLPDDCFCEAVRDQLVRQPVNAVSGLGFIGVGLLAVFGRRRKTGHGPELRGEGLAEYMFATATLVVGAGTVFYHASLTFVGQTLDVFGMYLLVTLIGLWIATGRWSLSPGMTAALGILINTLLLVLLIAAPEYRRIVFAALVVLVIGLESTVGRPGELGGRHVFWLAAAILAGGFVVWTMDYLRVACSPGSWLQGHAVWHLCGAAAVWLTIRYYAGHRTRSA